MNTSATTSVPTVIESTAPPLSSWSLRRRRTLLAALALILGGIAFACSSPDGFIVVEAHLIERRIMLGAAAMVGGFFLLAVHVLTGILAVQPRHDETTS